MDSSKSSPTPFLSSLRKLNPAAMAPLGLFSSSGLLSNITWPLAGKIPIMPLATPIFPCPARPPMPMISPFFTSRLKPFTSSPGIFTSRFLMLSTVSSLILREVEFVRSKDTLRPTINSAISYTLVSLVSFVTTCSPSRKMVTRWETCIISSKRWLINIIPIPCAANFSMAANRFWVSDSVKTAVGSSKTRSLIPVLSISLAISMNCMCPTGNPATWVYSSIPMLIMSRAFRASLFIFFISKPSYCLPNILLTRFGLVSSRLILMFSVIVKPGISINSWCTIPIPWAIASWGEANRTSLPSSSILPWYPPVSWIIGIPNNIFIKVDLPAPFSPMSAWISPFFISILMSFSTRLP